jgi:hypothetical protein
LNPFLAAIAVGEEELAKAEVELSVGLAQSSGSAAEIGLIPFALNMPETNKHLLAAFFLIRGIQERLERRFPEDAEKLTKVGKLINETIQRLAGGFV